MLRELRISNFIVVEEQTVSFGTGFNAISGESGSGKSVVLQALEFALGRRGNSTLIRPGAEQAEVQAIFDMTELPKQALAELPDVVTEAGAELLISRTLSRAGRSKVQVNGRLGTAGLLEEIGRVLLTVSSQREHMRLLDPQFHIELVDSYAALTPLLQRYSDEFLLWSELKKQLAELEERLSKSVFRRAELESISEELSAAKLRPGLRSELEAEVKRASAGEVILSAGQEVVDLLRSEEGAGTALRIAASRLHELSRHDQKLSEPAARLGAIRTEIEEVASDVSRYIAGITLNEERLAELRERLAEVARLERKYRAPDGALCELLEQVQQELSAAENPESLDKRRAELSISEQRLTELADELSAARRKASRKLLRSLEQELQSLGMQDAKLEVNHESVPFYHLGRDRMELLISVNKGMEPAPLRSVASGGELSRFFLAAKTTLGGRSGTPTLVFDEVDTGVSGKTARAVGEKLQALSKDSQLICITHLPQVASLADQHFTVEKRSGKVTSSLIRELSETEKVNEIARMLAGYEITGAARESAKELLSSKIKTP
jgi:DNA repair protein RecN (Recombination protein N)